MTFQSHRRGRSSIAARATIGGLVAMTLVAAGCAANSAAPPASVESPATQGAAMQPSPAPAQPSRSPGVDSGRITLADAAADMAKAEQDLSDALDPSKAIPLATDRCAIVCKALASMRVAAGHLCELTADDRCDDAKTRLARAESRAREACPVCAGG